MYARTISKVPAMRRLFASRHNATAARMVSTLGSAEPYSRTDAGWSAFSLLSGRAQRGELIVLDGATGTELTKHPSADVSGEEQWNGFPAQLFVPEAVADVHRSYIDVVC